MGWVQLRRQCPYVHSAAWAAGDYRFGYRGAGEDKGRDAAPNPDEQAVVARIMELRGEGQSYRLIAERLDAEGKRPRRAASWSAMSVRNRREGDDRGLVTVDQSHWPKVSNQGQVEASIPGEPSTGRTGAA